MSVNVNSWNDALMESFYVMARKINAKFSVIPVLIGSLGLQQLLDDDFRPAISM